MGLVDWEFENGTPDDDPDSLMIDSRNQVSSIFSKLDSICVNLS